MSKKIKFMGEDIEINKLSVAEVMAIQSQAQINSEADNNGMSILRTVIRSSVVEASDISDSEFETFPMDELSKLSTEIMKFSGIDTAGK
jgi:CO dehydrogenase nickel-insertion accessory protein CooC1